MNWKLSFISQKNLVMHVQETIKQYGEKLQSFDLKKFNKNIIDPIKLIFDKTIYRSSWEEIVGSEIFRQRDKSNNNDIGYFHQRIFQYIDNCEIPKSGWDIIYKNNQGIKLPTGDIVSTIYIEMKNKHNTMNSASSSKTFIKMQNQILNDDDCACFLVEVIAKKSQNIKWEISLDEKKQGHKLIRRVSIDEFYSLVTGQDDAFYQLCMVLPKIVNKVVSETESFSIPNDTVIHELNKNACELGLFDNELSFIIAVYLLGFGGYKGFK